MTNSSLKNGYLDRFIIFELFEHKNERKDWKSYQKLITSLIKSRIFFASHHIKTNEIITTSNSCEELADQVKFVSHALRSFAQLDQTHTFGLVSEQRHRFALYPVKVILNNGMEGYVYVYLSVFRQGYAILHLSLNIRDVEYEELNASVWDVGIEKAYFPEIMVNGEQSLKYKKKAKDIFY